MEEPYAGEQGKVKRALEVFREELNLSYEINIHVTGESDFINAGKKISQLLKKLKNEGYKIAVDITAGRKPLVAAALLPASKLDIDHLFYLDIKRVEGMNKPYYMIPLGIQRLRDFVQDASTKK